MAEGFDPEIGEAGARLLDGDPAPPPTVSRGRPTWRQTRPTQGSSARRGDRGASAASPVRRSASTNAREPMDPLIPPVGLPAPPEALDHRPAPETAQRAAPVEVEPAAPGDPVGDEGPVGRPGPAAGAEVAEDRRGRLPGTGDRPQEGAVAGPGIPLQGAEVRNDLRAQRMEAEVPDELQQVRGLLHEDGPVPVLAEVAHPLVAAVEGPGLRQGREGARHTPPDPDHPGRGPGAPAPAP
jgi:hypothetical protein